MGRNKAKSYPQPNDFTCGPASLKTALGILGVKRSFKSLQKACRTSPRHGTSIRNMIKAINQHGLHAMTVEWSTLTHLQNAIKTKNGQPRAVIVDYLYQDEEPYEDTGHYATVARYSARDSRLVLFDSSDGSKKSYKWTDFLDRWYDYDYHRIKAKHSVKKGTLYKKWHNRLMIVITKDAYHLPNFKISTAKVYSPSIL